jgi:hypothetical protein
MGQWHGKLIKKHKVLEWYQNLSETTRNLLYIEQWIASCDEAGVFIVAGKGREKKAVGRIGKRGLDWFELGEADLEAGAMNLIVRPIKGLKVQGVTKLKEAVESERQF